MTFAAWSTGPANGPSAWGGLGFACHFNGRIDCPRLSQQAHDRAGVTLLATQPLSSLIFGTYTALVYLTPIFGGLIADRVLGQRRTVVIGAALMAIGHFMMVFEPLFLFALLFLILGNGAFKPNISTQVGALYAPGDQRRDRAYSIFYVGINIGAFISPLVCGWLAEAYGWHFGFAAAGNIGRQRHVALHDRLAARVEARRHETVHGLADVLHRPHVVDDERAVQRMRVPEDVDRGRVRRAQAADTRRRDALAVELFARQRLRRSRHVPVRHLHRSL